MTTKLLIKFISILLISAGALSCTNNKPQAEQQNTFILTDSTLESAIRTEFHVHPYIASSKIQITAEDGIVTLYGAVDNLLAYQKAEELVGMIRGVRGVVNLIEVETTMVDANELKQQVEKLLANDPVLKAQEIEVEVDSGIVDLQGKVESWHQKQFAAEVIKSLKGIRKVNNNLAFIYVENRPADEIKSNIGGLLRNDVRIEDGMIDVNVKGRTVILSGTVGSASEKSLAIVHAWVPGIDTVTAKALEVSPDKRDRLMRIDKYVNRSDDELIEAIRMAFKEDPRLTDYNIQVALDKGNATLTGTVNHLRAKKAAEENASNIVGVWSVDNKIRIEPDEMLEKGGLASKVENAIDQHPVFNTLDITITQNDKQAVNIHGEVRYYFEKIQIENFISTISGVSDITNEVKVMEGRPLPYTFSPENYDYPVIRQTQEKGDDEIKKDVIYQLWWSPFVDRDQITVEVENGSVTLSGTVNTTVERDYAIINAFEGGALEVEDQLKVDYMQK
ncbi:MAG: BON domain-containing protein [Bacteroidetes bacterium]|nr:BON domain-containing protein [Bacteroidota bacterium]